MLRGVVGHFRGAGPSARRATLRELLGARLRHLRVSARQPLPNFLLRLATRGHSFGGFDASRFIGCDRGDGQINLA